MKPNTMWIDFNEMALEDIYYVCENYNYELVIEDGYVTKWRVL